LELGNVTEALRNFPENERNTLSSAEGIHAGPGNPNLNIINEPGLYRLIFQSRKPEAEAFKTWVFSEVLPAIRKHGYFAARPPLAIDPAIDFKGVALMLRAFILGAITGAQFRQMIGLAPQDYQLESHSLYKETKRLRFDAAIAKDDVRLFIEKAVIFEKDAITPAAEVYEAYRDYYDIDDVAVEIGEALSRFQFTRFVSGEYRNIAEKVARAGPEKKVTRCYAGLKLRPCEEEL
jgi:hypothetical protein